MQTKGMDFTLAYNNKAGDFTYGAQMNLTTFDSKTTKLPSKAPIYNGDSKTEEGQEPAYYYGFVSDGIFQNQSELTAYTKNGVQMQPNSKVGDIRFKDLNHDGTINGDDRTKIGSPWAKFTSGLSLLGSYKNFDVRADFYCSYGNDLIFYERADLYGNLQNRQNKVSGLVNKAWHGEGTSSTVPILTYNDNNNNFRFSNLSVQDGSFLRLRNLSVGYSIPQIWGIKNTRISLSAQNLFTLTKYQGTNPEQIGEISRYGVSSWAYPMAPTYFLGVKFSL
jgi:TonB-dependent starch-binding outer membrane protein SusC